jgi:hypothetical protein
MKMYNEMLSEGLGELGGLRGRGSDAFDDEGIMCEFDDLENVDSYIEGIRRVASRLNG